MRGCFKLGNQKFRYYKCREFRSAEQIIASKETLNFLDLFTYLFKQLVVLLVDCLVCWFFFFLCHNSPTHA
jgi:hypothetical protein